METAASLSGAWSGKQLEVTLCSLLEFIREAMPSHALCERIEQALASGDVAAMRSAMQGWYDLPLPDREALCKSEIVSQHR